MSGTAPSSTGRSPRQAMGAPGSAEYSQRRGRTVELDGVRGLAILVVMLHHMTVLRPDNALDRWILGRAEMGASGVDLFFVLSGFLITGILLDSRREAHYFRNFYIRRTLRIFPLYYAVVALSLLVLPQFSHPKVANFGRIAGDEIWYWLYLSNFSIAAHNAFRHAILDISWSLAIEEQFYLIWPAVVWFLSARALKRLCLTLIVVAPLLRAVAVALDTGWIPVYVLTPFRMDALAFGALIALLAREGSLSRYRDAAVWIMAAGAAVLSWFGFTSDEFRAVPAAAIIVYSATGAGCAALLVFLLTGDAESRTRRFFRGRILTALGAYSYALYLVHLPLRALLRDTIFGPAKFPRLGNSALPGQLLFYLAACALSFVVAYASWHVFEKWFVKLKERFPARSAQASRADGGIEGEPSEPVPFRG